MTVNELEVLRNKVDEINLQILRLLNERAVVVKAIGQQKEFTRYETF
ncbi:hypothetical protein GCM10020331_076760 [Ectobacillus funiculus]